MSVVRPTHDWGRITLLRTALESSRRDEAAGRTYLTPTVRDALEAQAAQLETASLAVAQAEAEQKQALAAADAAVEAIQAQVRQSWSTLRWRVRWQSLTPAVLPYYQLRPNQTPKPPNRVGWLELAEQLILGDAAAQAAGFASAIDPIALPGARNGLQAALEQVNRSQERLHSLRLQLRSVRGQSDRVIRHLLGDLRHALREENAASQQQIMRTYGARFRRLRQSHSDEGGDNLPLQGEVMGWQLQPQAIPTAQSA